MDHDEGKEMSLSLPADLDAPHERPGNMDMAVLRAWRWSTYHPVLLWSQSISCCVERSSSP